MIFFFFFFNVQVTKKSLRLMVTMQKNSEIVDFTTITYVLLQNIFKEIFMGCLVCRDITSHCNITLI